jgi:hypothetical protein
MTKHSFNKACKNIYVYRGGRLTRKDKTIVRDVAVSNKVSPISDEAHEYVGQKQQIVVTAGKDPHFNLRMGGRTWQFVNIVINTLNL